MDSENLINRMKPIVEGLVFTSGEDGLSLIQIQSVLDCTRDEISRTLFILQQEYQDEQRGVELVKYGGRWKFVTKESVYPYASKLYAKAQNNTLSAAAMEVLSLVAYRQPITRVEIDDIRGVSSEMMLKKLQARDLIETCGHKETIGRPLLYQVSARFYDTFGLESLEDLPQTQQKQGPDNLFYQPDFSEVVQDEIDQQNRQDKNDPDLLDNSLTAAIHIKENENT